MSFIRSSLRRLPFMSTLLDARSSDYAEAFKEVGLNVILSTVPIWLGAFFLSINVHSQNYLINVLSNLQSGELYLYSTAMLAPLYYFLFKEYAGTSQFPGVRLFMIICLLLTILAAGLFGLRSARVLLGVPLPLDESKIFRWSALIYGSSILLAYIAHVYKNFVEAGAADLQRSETAEFVKDFQSRRREN